MHSMIEMQKISSLVIVVARASKSDEICHNQGDFFACEHAGLNNTVIT